MIKSNKEGSKMYCVFQENNAVARIDINSYSVNEIFALGIKNWTLYNTDCSDQDGGRI